MNKWLASRRSLYGDIDELNGLRVCRARKLQQRPGLTLDCYAPDAYIAEARDHNKLAALGESGSLYSEILSLIVIKSDARLVVAVCRKFLKERQISSLGSLKRERAKVLGPLHPQLNKLR